MGRSFNRAHQRRNYVGGRGRKTAFSCGARHHPVLPTLPSGRVKPPSLQPVCKGRQERAVWGGGAAQTTTNRSYAPRISPPTRHARACPGHPVAAAGGVPLRKTPPPNTNTDQKVLRRMTARAARLLDCRIKSGNDGGGLEPAITHNCHPGTCCRDPLASPLAASISFYNCPLIIPPIGENPPVLSSGLIIFIWTVINGLRGSPKAERVEWEKKSEKAEVAKRFSSLSRAAYTAQIQPPPLNICHLVRCSEIAIG